MKMQLKLKQDSIEIFPVNELAWGQFAIGVGDFSGEIFYRNVAGLIGLSADRFWADPDYTKKRGDYIPTFTVRLATSQDTFGF